MFSAIANLFRIADIRRRIIVTVTLLFIYRIGSAIPLPGVNFTALDAIAKERADSGVLSMIGVFSALSGGNLHVPVLFSLGILPYISASIILSLLAKMLPSLEALSKEGAAGQKKINQYARYLTVPMALVQGLVISMTAFKSFRDPMTVEGIGQFTVIPDYGAGFVLTATIGITAGTVFLMWLGELVTEYGIGNGASLLISIGIVSDVPLAFQRILKNAAEDRTQILVALALMAAYLLIILGVVYLHRGQRRIPMNQQRVTRGGQTQGGGVNRNYLPLRLNMANVMPIIFASTLLAVPSQIATWAGGAGGGLAAGSWLHVLIYVALIVFFSYFWTSMMFEPKEIANNLKESGQFVPGYTPGKPTAAFLERILSRITLIGAFFVSVIAVIPDILSRGLGIDGLVASFMGGTGIMIVVGVTLDIVDKLNAGLQMRKYEGFMGTSAKRPAGMVRS